MSDFIKHECGIAFIRLRKPLHYFIEKYGTPLYAINKMQILMEKQKNRGQDGAGIACLKLNVPLGQRYFNRVRSAETDALTEVFRKIYKSFKKVSDKKMKKADWLKDNCDFIGEVMLGHLRYGTHGTNSVAKCHPFMRENNWQTRNLIMAGNFNLTNTSQLFQQLVDIGQFPKEKSDTVTVLEKIGHFLDEEVQIIFRKYKDAGLSRKEITDKIIEELDPKNFLKKAANDFDGGYAMVGLIGHGDSFVFRDPNGIRPAFYYVNDEVIVAASERPAIQAAFGILPNKINELQPGNALIVKSNGNFSEEEILPKGEKLACSFERIYFSRGNDKNIYKERKELGYLLAPKVLEAINYEVDSTVFSFIPNTAEVSYYGLIKGLENHFDERKLEKLAQTSDKAEIKKILNNKIRVEKIAIKDAKLRTFISSDSGRNDLVNSVYDVTWGIVKNGKDTLVVIDDSIVRGTTLRESIIGNLDKLRPKKIIVLSSAPQIRYPDCYGIDMSKLGNFIAFRACLELIKENKTANFLEEIYENCKAENKKALPENAVKAFYEPFSADEISAKISKMLKAEHINAEVEIIYQSISNLHLACPNHKGDWYFTGNYPTSGGNRVANRAFINFFEGRGNERAY